MPLRLFNRVYFILFYFLQCKNPHSTYNLILSRQHPLIKRLFPIHSPNNSIISKLKMACDVYGLAPLHQKEQ